MVGHCNNDAGAITRRYVHGVGSDDPIVWYEGSDTSDSRDYVKDRLGSIIGVTNSQGDIIDKNSYSDFGVPDSENIGRFQYTGQMWIAEAGVFHYKARSYDPNLRRFLQTDPIGYAAGMNIYAYVGGDPINFVDPSGFNRIKPEACRLSPTGVSCSSGSGSGHRRGVSGGSAFNVTGGVILTNNGTRGYGVLTAGIKGGILVGTSRGEWCQCDG